MTVTRRSFLSTTTAAACTAALGVPPRAKMPRLSVQMYSIREVFWKEPEKNLERLRAAGFDETYIDWLEQFVAVESSAADDFFDFGDWGDLWGGWGTAGDDFNWNDWPLSGIWEDEDWTDGDWADDDWFDLLFGNH